MNSKEGTSSPVDPPGQVAAEAVRRHALALHAAAAAAFERLLSAADPEALHDFRVALRRLRATLKAYEPELDGSAPRKVRRRLRKIARATSRSRDLEVQLEWLTRQRRFGNRQRQGVDWLTHLLERQQAAAADESATYVREHFPAASRMALQNLSTYRKPVSLSTVDAAPTYERVAAERIAEAAGTLRDSLRLIQRSDDASAVHSARIAGKRLRYLLEPVAQSTPAARKLTTQLKKLQDVTGKLHDALVLGQVILDRMRRVDAAVVRAELGSPSQPPDVSFEDVRRGLMAIARRLRAEITRMYASLQSNWLADSSVEFFATVDAAVAELAARADKHSAGVEIERKFLLDGLPASVGTVTPISIEQGWLPGRQLLERLRVERNGSGERYYRTVKSGRGLARIELEETTSAKVFDAMWPLTEGRRVLKNRYEIPEGGHLWQIDEFIGRELVLAEVELAGEEEQVALPDWLAPHVVREVTGEPEFVNANLAR